MKNLSCFLNEPTQWDGNSQDRQLVPVLNAYLSCIKKSGPLNFALVWICLPEIDYIWVHRRKLTLFSELGCRPWISYWDPVRFYPQELVYCFLLSFFFLGEILQLLDFGVIIRRRGIVWKIWLRYTRRYLFEKFCFILIFFLLNPEI